MSHESRITMLNAIGLLAAVRELFPENIQLSIESNSAPISWLIAELIAVYPPTVTPLWLSSPVPGPGGFSERGGGMSGGGGMLRVCPAVPSYWRIAKTYRDRGILCDKYLVKCVASIDEVWTLNGHKVFMDPPPRGSVFQDMENFLCREFEIETLINDAEMEKQH